MYDSLCASLKSHLNGWIRSTMLHSLHSSWTGNGQFSAVLTMISSQICSSFIRGPQIRRKLKMVFGRVWLHGTLDTFCCLLHTIYILLLCKGKHLAAYKNNKWQICRLKETCKDMLHNIQDYMIIMTKRIHNNLSTEIKYYYY